MVVLKKGNIINTVSQKTTCRRPNQLVAEDVEDSNYRMSKDDDEPLINRSPRTPKLVVEAVEDRNESTISPLEPVEDSNYSTRSLLQDEENYYSTRSELEAVVVEDGTFSSPPEEKLIQETDENEKILDSKVVDHDLEDDYSRHQRELKTAIQSVLKEANLKAQTQISDTGTIHMLAIKAVTETSPEDSRTSFRSSCRPLLYALFSLLFVMIQSLALYMMVIESTTIPCSTHNDCQDGQYCEYDYGTGDGGSRNQKHQKALCLDCGILLGRRVPNPFDPIRCNRPEITEIDNVGPNVVWIDKYGYPVYDKSKYPEDDDYWCLAWHHCQQTEMYVSQTRSNSSVRDGRKMFTTDPPPQPNRHLRRRTKSAFFSTDDDMRQPVDEEDKPQNHSEQNHGLFDDKFNSGGYINFDDDEIAGAPIGGGDSGSTGDEPSNMSTTNNKQTEPPPSSDDDKPQNYIDFDDYYYGDYFVKQGPEETTGYAPIMNDDALAKDSAEGIEQCDYLVLVKNKLTNAEAVIFACMTILLVVHMTFDIEEGTIEEALLLKKTGITGVVGRVDRSTTSSTGSRTTANKFSSIPALILLVSLRLRRFVLPWALAMAVIVITLTEDLSMKNILLNVVALEFILNADSLFAKYCHKPSGQEAAKTDTVTTIEHQEEEGRGIGESQRSDMEEITVKEGIDYSSWWSSRIESFMIGVVIVFTVLKTQTMVKAWYYISPASSGKRWNTGCEHLLSTLWQMLIYCPLLNSILHAIYQGTKMMLKKGNITSQRGITGSEYPISSSMENVEQDNHQNNRHVPKQKCIRAIFILLEALFQCMASFSACYLYIFFKCIIGMKYYTTALVLADVNPFRTYVILVIVSWVVYLFLGFVKLSFI